MRWLVLVLVVAGCAVERAAVCDTCEAQGVHPAGYAIASSPDFHGHDLESHGWDLERCQTCHGTQLDGNPPAPACESCHDKPPTACDTCHGDPPTTAAHTAHRARDLPCSECHVVPDSWDSHRRPADRHALVTFGALARVAGAAPSWDGERCSGVYCHGSTLADTAASNVQPRWTGGASEAACGTCHGVPPASHARNQCATCHVASTHVDGVIDVATACAGGCHGDASSSAPDVGAHRAHLAGGFFSQPIACSECHRVPAAVGDAGHIDSEDPAEVTFGPLASARGAAPVWNGATCSNVYCHGSSTTTWTGTGPDNAYCGSCHGLPPSSAPHTTQMTVTDCSSCHAATVGPFGNILVTGGRHINGVIDVD